LLTTGTSEHNQVKLSMAQNALTGTVVIHNFTEEAAAGDNELS